MNWKELPPGDWHSESESAEEHERLSEIERRLKTARPNPVQLDAAAWERIISASETPLMPEQETVRLTGHATPGRRRWLGRAVGTIAAAWLGGVVVGSGAMFLMMSRGRGITQEDYHQASAALAPQNTDPRDFQDSSASPGTAPKSTNHLGGSTTDKPPVGAPFADPSALALGTDGDETHAVTIDSVHEIASAAWLDVPASSMERPLRPFGDTRFRSSTSGTLPSRLRPSDRLRQGERLQQSESQRELARSFVPPPGATPRRIWEELRMDRVALGRPL